MINRTKVNDSEVSAQNPNKSGFNLSYDSYNDYILGRAHVSGYQYVMPASKFSGHNKGDFMFHLVGTEFVAPIDATQFNVAVSLRSIDNTFEDAFSPSKNNDMSINWRTPTFTLRAKVAELLEALGVIDSSHAWATAFAKVMTFSSTSSSTLGNALTAAEITSLKAWIGITLGFNAATLKLFEDHYLSDAIDDFYDFFRQSIQDMTQASTNLRQYRYMFFYYLLKPFFGEGSLLDELGYIIIRNEDLKILFIERTNTTPLLVDAIDGDDLLNVLDASPQCEYGLRAYYATWYQLLRDPNLESVSSTLPKWKQFGSTSVVTLPFFCHRFRSWYDDMYVGAQPDDMMRHVYAPIFTTEDSGDFSGPIVQSNSVVYPSSGFDYIQAEVNPGPLSNQHSIASQSLTWRDPVTGSVRFMDVPLPALVNDSLRSSNSSSDVYSLDLFNLRQAQALERYLKRNFYFGDEYKERMLAHYGSEISDYRLNYPTLLSSSINAASQDRLVNNTATDKSVAGERKVNMTIQSSGDGYESFAEEFTIVLNLISFNPRPQYQGVSGFNLLYRQMDFPVPEFAANNEELSRIYEIVCSGLSKDNNPSGKQTFGHHPYAHIWRSRVDEAHGSFRSSRAACLFTRYFSADDSDPSTFPKLNYKFIHCRPNLDMFLNTIRLDAQLSGNVSHSFYVESPLPVPVESI